MLKYYLRDSKKEFNDFDVIDSGVKSAAEFGNDEMVPHFIYCGYHYSWRKKSRILLQQIILTKMKSCGIGSAVLTMLGMSRRKLVTKEKVKQAYKGKLKDDQEWEIYGGSINDELENFLFKIQDQGATQEELVRSFYTPKLTKEELKLVQEKNEKMLNTLSEHYFQRNPDVDVDEMKKSNSKSKYVQGVCWRDTIPLTVKAYDKRSMDDQLLENQIKRQKTFLLEDKK